MKRFVQWVLTIYWCFTSGVLLAYNASGHEISALIAWDLLNTKEQDTIVQWLKEHPRFEQDFLLSRKPKSEADFKKWVFARAASWPDAPRDQQRFNQKLQHKYHRARWHYTTRYIIPEHYKNNLRLKQAAVETSNYQPTSVYQYDVILAYEYNLGRAKSHAIEPTERALALTWIFHLIGDIHQPLHSTSVFTANRWSAGDRGGNDIATKENTYAKTRNLHNYWDWALSNRTSFRYNANVAGKLKKKHSELGMQARDSMQISDWVSESHHIAVQYVYSPLVLNWLIQMDTQTGNVEPLILTEEYRLQAVDVSEQQVVKAGYRLAEALKAVIKAVE